MRDIMKFIFICAVLKIGAYEAFSLTLNSFDPAQWGHLDRTALSAWLLFSWPLSLFISYKTKRL